MNNQQTHTIRSCHWQTHFDSKSNAVALQSQLSNWTLHQMSREIYGLLDEICSENTLLKIKTLELNLGLLDFDNLEEQLSLRFKTALAEALKQTIDDYNETNIEFIDIKQSYLEVIRDFLYSGVTSHVGRKQHSIHELLTILFQDNRMNLIHLIRSIAAHENVRRRMAWQFSERHIKEVIKSVEPSHHNEIFDFADELNELQRQENIVRSSASEFKKSVWFWILNYLFVERGTMFNRIQFVESTLIQMARHFNLEHDELFELIEEALSRIDNGSRRKAELLSVLKVVSKKRESESYKANTTQKQQEKYWSILQLMVETKSERSTQQQKSFFNELVYQLSIQDSKRFVQLFSKKSDRIKDWLPLMEDVNTASFQAILYSFETSKGELLFRQYQQVQQLEVIKKLSVRPSLLKAITLVFAVQNKTKIINAHTYTYFVIERLSKQLKMTEERFLEQFISTEKLDKGKEVSLLKTHGLFGELYKARVLQSKKPDATVQSLTYVLSESNEERRRIIIEYWIEEQPLILWQVLLKEKELLVAFTEKVTTINLLKLLSKVDREKAILIKRVLSILENTEIKISVQETYLLQKVLVKNAIQFSVLKQEQQLDTFLKETLQWIPFKEEIWLQEDIDLVIKNLWQQAENRKLVSPVIQSKSIQQKKTAITTFNRIEENVVEELHTAIQENIVSTQEVAKVFANLLNNQKVSIQELEKSEKRLVSIFFKKSLKQKEVYKPFIASIVEFARITSIKAEYILKELFWKVVFTYQQHQGDIHKYNKAFETAVEQRFDLTQKKEEFETKSKAKKRSAEEEQLRTKKGLTHKNASKKEETVRLKSESKVEQSSIDQSKSEEKQSTKSKDTKQPIQTESKEKQQLEKEEQLSTHKYSVKRLEFEQDIISEFKTKKALINFLLKEENHVRITQEQFGQLKLQLEQKELIALLASNRLSSKHPVFVGIYELIQLVEKSGVTLKSLDLEETIWEVLYEVFTQKTTSKSALKRLVKEVLVALAKTQEFDIQIFAQKLEKEKLSVFKDVWIYLVAEQPSFQRLFVSEKTDITTDIFTTYTEKKLSQLVEALVVKNEIPAWFAHERPYTVRSLLHEILEVHPTLVVQVLQEKKVDKEIIQQVVRHLKGEETLEILQRIHPSQQQLLKGIQTLYKVLGSQSIQHVSGHQLQQSLLKIIISAWIENHWESLQEENIWQSVFWEFWTEHKINKEAVLEVLQPLENVLPTALKVDLRNVEKNNHKPIPQEKVDRSRMKREIETQLKEGVAIRNAGLVLLNTYFQMLFERLEIVKNKEFISKDVQLDAVHYLQYIVTGLQETEESDLVLNKVLCGLDLIEPVRSGIQMTAAQKELIDGMIQSSVAYWSSIGDTTVYGFRGNWLVREGVLREEFDRWELTVEKRSYDILMQKSPFSFSIIKLPWMKKPLHVKWPY